MSSRVRFGTQQHRAEVTAGVPGIVSKNILFSRLNTSNFLSLATPL